MKLIHRICLISFIISLTASPVFAQAKLNISVPERPAGPGEGIPLPIGELPEGIPGGGISIVNSEVLTGKLKVKGKSTKRYFIKPVKGKKIELQISDEDTEKAVSMNKKTVTIEGFYLDNSFLVVRFQ